MKTCRRRFFPVTVLSGYIINDSGAARSIIYNRESGSRNLTSFRVNNRFFGFFGAGFSRIGR